MAEVKYHPLPCSDWEVRAFLDGSRTQFRRPMDPQPIGNGPGGCPIPIVGAYPVGAAWDFQSADGATQAIIRCPFGQAGDRLRVQEDWATTGHETAWDHPTGRVGIVYRADEKTELRLAPNAETVRRIHRTASKRWRPSATMPHWASRLTLEVVDARPKQEEGAWVWAGTVRRLTDG